MILRWIILLMAFAVPVLPVLGLAAGQTHAARFNIAALALGALMLALWLVVTRGKPTLANDEMAHAVKNRVASGFIIVQNAALLGVLVLGKLQGLTDQGLLKAVYAVLLLGIWSYAVTVGITWRSLGRGPE